MTAETVTTVVGVVISVLGGVLIPLYLTHRKNTQSHDHSDVLDSTNVARMMKDERDRLQARLDAIETNHQQQIDKLKNDSEQALAAAEAKWRLQSEKDQAQIEQLKQEVESLYKRLFQTRPPA
ncbi:MAG: hypothetical protein ACRDQX_10765 [Pseudonocardiaceae bacterium]